MPPVAHIEHKGAPLSSPWAYGVACEKFGKELVDLFPRITRGPRKGQLKGYLLWAKITRGGWVVDGPGAGNGHVETPGAKYWRLAMEWNQFDGHDWEGSRGDVVAYWDWRDGVRTYVHPMVADAMAKQSGTPTYSSKYRSFDALREQFEGPAPWQTSYSCHNRERFGYVMFTDDFGDLHIRNVYGGAAP